MSCNKYIQEYLDLVDSGDIAVCKEQKLLSKFIKKIFATENLIIDDVKVEKYFSYQKYFPFELFAWEKFLFILHNCTFREDGQPRFPDLFAIMGRGAGKNGYLSFEDFCLLTDTHGIRNYDIDISANSEEQAKTSFNDIYNILEDTRFKKKMKKHFYWNKEEIINLKTQSKLKFRTNNPKGKDGLRSGKVDFDEIHAYQNWDNINVFTTGLGKKEHPRRTYITTNGDVRDGPLDNLLSKSLMILNGEIEDNGFLPFICRLDDEEEVHDEKNWVKANPSLPYRQGLLDQLRKEYSDYKINPYLNSAFMTKRMNIPKSKCDMEITSWDNILATNREIPDLSGYDCVLGFDYTKVNDMTSAGLLFYKNDNYYWITHSWFCTQSDDKDRIKAPLTQWRDEGFLTFVDDVEVNPDLICNWVNKQLVNYNVIKTGLDQYRLSIIRKSLQSILAIDISDKKQVKIIRPSDIMKIIPVIDSLFNNHKIVFGNNPLMRWFTNNTKLVERSMGNFMYEKIEYKSRKNDGFMAFVHAVIAAQDLLETLDTNELIFVDPITF